MRPEQVYPSDVTDERWNHIEPFLPYSSKKYPKREIFNGLLYILRTGIPWRYLPKDFPPYKVVQQVFYLWRDTRVFEELNFLLTIEERQKLSREVSPSAAIVDSQSVKTTEKGG